MANLSVRGDLYDEVVSALYDSVLDETAWSRLGRKLGATTGVDGFHLAILGADCFDPNLVFSRLHVAGRPVPDIEELYVRDYLPIDERIPRLRRLPAGQLTHNRSLFTDRERRTSPVYNEFLKSVGGRNQIAAKLPNPDGPGMDFCVFTRQNPDSWDGDQVALIERVLPHMGRFLSLRRALARADAANRSLAGMLEDAATGVILLDERNRVLECNTLARRTLAAAGPLSIQDGELRSANPRDTALHAALARARKGPGSVGGSVRLAYTECDGKRRHMTVRIVPTSAEEPNFGPGGTAVLVLLVDGRLRSSPRLDVLQVAKSLGLTESQAQVACLLAQGHTVREIAVQSHRTEHTIRYHLKQAFARTGARRQAELVGLVLAAARA